MQEEEEPPIGRPFQVPRTIQQGHGSEHAPGPTLPDLPGPDRVTPHWSPMSHGPGDHLIQGQAPRPGWPGPHTAHRDQGAHTKNEHA